MNVVDIEPRRRPAELLSAALEFAKLGWHVVPLYEPASAQACSCPEGAECHSPGKHPRLRKGYTPSRDEQMIRGWWKRWPLSNIGIWSGPSDLVILDIDPRNAGDDTLAALEAQHGELPEGPTALTSRGGQHYYFARPDGILELPAGKLGPGIDVKADSGYVVAPPSAHYLGGLYEWDAARGLELPLPVCPPWVVRMLADSIVRRTHGGSDPAGPSAGLMGAAFAAAGMSGRQLGPDKVAVQCPWEGEHTCGKSLDGSTVVFAPELGHRMGWFHCSHSHCTGREQRDVLESLPPAAVAAARRALNMDPDAMPRAPLNTAPTRAAEPPPTRAAPSVQEPPSIPDEHADWRKSLRYNDKGILTKDVGNIALVLGNDPQWRGVLRYDAFADSVEWAAAPPAIPGLRTPEPGRALQDDDFLYVQHWFARVRYVSFGPDHVRAGVVSAARRHERDTLRDYIEALEWDGVPRIEAWTAKYLGSTDTKYSRFVGRAWLVSAIARALDPGCQADHALVLEGNQGAGKSSALRALSYPWFLPEMPPVLNKDSLVVLAGMWIANFEELSGLRASDLEKVKAFLTQRTDVYRPPYGRTAVKRQRRVVFCATTNRKDYLRDPTGHRRFWPIRCGVAGRIQVAALERDRGQIWAEALHAYRSQAKWHPEDGELQATIAAEQAAREGDVDPWEELIRRATLRQPDRVWTITDVFAEVLSVDPGKRTDSDARRIGRAFRRIGYQRRTERGEQLWEASVD